MNITRTQIGELIGALILAIIWNLIAYLVIAFCTWDLNPASWPVAARVTDVIVVMILVIIHLIRTKIVVVPDEE